jgi:hypothetical protein
MHNSDGYQIKSKIIGFGGLSGGGSSVGRVPVTVEAMVQGKEYKFEQILGGCLTG